MKNKITYWLNVFIGVMSIGSWLYMVFRGNDGGMLSSSRLESLKYFTVLSNLLNGAVCLLFAYKTYKQQDFSKYRLCKLLGTTGVTLTFLTVMSFLGPVFGYGSMFRGTNFWMHLILPLVSIGSFIFLEDYPDFTWKNAIHVIWFPLIYEIGYVGNIILHGIGEWPHSNDFYGFLSWGYGIGAVIAVVVLLVMWLIAVILTTLQRKAHQNG